MSAWVSTSCDNLSFRVSTYNGDTVIVTADSDRTCRVLTIHMSEIDARDLAAKLIASAGALEDQEVDDMSTITTAPFGNADAIRAADAANAAFVRAIHLGYSIVASRQFSRIAKREASEWESQRETALRVVMPKTATFSGHPGGAL